MDTPTRLNKQQIDALFDEASKDMTPAETPAIPLARRLAPYRRTLLEYRKKGYSTAQLAEILKKPNIGIEVSAQFLRRYLCPSGKQSRHARTTLNAALPPVRPTPTGLPLMRPVTAPASPSPHTGR